MQLNEELIVFHSKNNALIGTLHRPETQVSKMGVLICVGGPQTRTGSHRQFILLARFLAQNGIPVFRYDYSGMGDSSGLKTDFLKAAPDLEAAINQFMTKANIENLCFWGLCDAVSLGLMYLSAKQDQRVIKFIAANPWVRQTHTEAKAYLKNYYLKRLTDKALWIKIIKLQFDFVGSIKSLSHLLINALKPVSKNRNNEESQLSKKDQLEWPEFTEDNYVSSMLIGLQNVGSGFNLILSENDLTADEFQVLVSSDISWKRTIEQYCSSTTVIQGATHTFSSKRWRDEVANTTLKICLNS